MNWLDKSDGKARFYVAESDVETNGDALREVIHELLSFVLWRLLRSGESVEFDTLFVEVNCDTGRIIVSPSTDASRVRGVLHGCAVRLTKLQDLWYDLDECGVSGEEFHWSIQNEVRRIGHYFETELRTKFSDFSVASKNGSIELVVFGSDPEKVILRKKIVPELIRREISLF